MTDRQGERFREYLLKGGFAIFDDFEYDQWNNLEAQMRRLFLKLAGFNSRRRIASSIRSSGWSTSTSLTPCTESSRRTTASLKTTTPRSA